MLLIAEPSLQSQLKAFVGNTPSDVSRVLRVLSTCMVPQGGVHPHLSPFRATWPLLDPAKHTFRLCAFALAHLSHRSILLTEFKINSTLTSSVSAPWPPCYKGLPLPTSHTIPRLYQPVSPTFPTLLAWLSFSLVTSNHVAHIYSCVAFITLEHEAGPSVLCCILST